MIVKYCTDCHRTQGCTGESKTALASGPSDIKSSKLTALLFRIPTTLFLTTVSSCWSLNEPYVQDGKCSTLRTAINSFAFFKTPQSVHSSHKLSNVNVSFQEYKWNLCLIVHFMLIHSLASLKALGLWAPQGLLWAGIMNGGLRQSQINEYIVLCTSTKASFCHTRVNIIFFPAENTGFLPKQKFTRFTVVFRNNDKEYCFNLRIWSIWLIRMLITMSISMVNIHQYLILFQRQHMQFESHYHWWPLWFHLYFLFMLYVPFLFIL